MSLVTGDKSNFQFILRLLNTNVDGKQKVMYALTKIKGVGRRYSNLVCKKADIDLNKRYARETFSCSSSSNPLQFLPVLPTWFKVGLRAVGRGKAWIGKGGNLESIGSEY